MLFSNSNSALNRPISLSFLFKLLIVAVLIAGNVFLYFKYSGARKELSQVKISLEAQKTDVKVLNFSKLFIAKVLGAQGEIDFETRLKLENAVRDLNDNEILTQWQKFVQSQNAADAQTGVKDLLKMLIDKIRI